MYVSRRSPHRKKLINSTYYPNYFNAGNASPNYSPLKANILIDDNHHACIADFGLSRLARDLDLPSTSQLSSLGGALRWTAPELYAFGEVIPCVTLYSDIYSFGSIALEVSTIAF